MQDILCFSHLHWDFVYQRPQHLLSRFAKITNVYYLEEPRNSDSDFYEVTLHKAVSVVRLFANLDSENLNQRLESLISQFLKEMEISSYNIWYYTPMALKYTTHLTPRKVIYDSMDELSAFRFAPPELLAMEDQLFQWADIVFTGGHSLYEAKKHKHSNIYPFPSSIDKSHFMQARQASDDPEDQAFIPHPRLGFFGVIDERFDIDLLREVAHRRSDWQFVIIGPVVKIDANELPRAENIHYLGPKTYEQLPAYIGHWDIAMIMFAINESTEFISPTKTPEYLAAGLPVISTPIKDVIRPYGEQGLVNIAGDAETFLRCAEEIFSKNSNPEWLAKVDAFLADQSWDQTFEQMTELIEMVKKNDSSYV